MSEKEILEQEQEVQEETEVQVSDNSQVEEIIYSINEIIVDLERLRGIFEHNG